MIVSELTAQWLGFGVSSMLCLGILAGANFLLDHSKSLMLFLTLQLLLLIALQYWSDYLIDAQKEISRALTPAVAERTYDWQMLQRLHSAKGGLARALIFAPVPASIWALRAGVSWSVLPLMIWGVVSLLVLAGLLGFLGVPGGVLS